MSFTSWRWWKISNWLYWDKVLDLLLCKTKNCIIFLYKKKYSSVSSRYSWSQWKFLCLVCPYVGIGRMTWREGNTKKVREGQHLVVFVECSFNFSRLDAYHINEMCIPFKYGRSEKSMKTQERWRWVGNCYSSAEWKLDVK